MRFMVIVKSTAATEAGAMPDEEMLAGMGAYNEALVKAGVMKSGDGLHPTSRGARVRFSGDGRTVQRGPFGGDPDDLVAGFWIWECDSLDHAIEWVKRCPNPMPGPSTIEVRQIFEAEDFGAEYTPAVREQEDRLRAELAKR